MKRETKIILTIVVVVLIIILLWFFLHKKTSTIPNVTGEIPCLVFQSEDQSRPCYRESPVGQKDQENSQNKGNLPVTNIPVSLSGCSQSVQIERDDCVTNKAIENNDTKLCDYVTGPVSRSNCNKSVTGGEKTETINTGLIQSQQTLVAAPTTYQNITPLNTTSNLSPISSMDKLLQDNISESKVALDNPDPHLTLQGYYDRLVATSSNVLFAVMPYQITQGQKATIYGQGFPTTDNVLHIGSYEIPNLTCSDASTMTTTIPTSIPNGEYEVWVTNSKGSTKNPRQVIKLLITSNPKPLPKITSITPANPTIDDTVTLSGESLTNIYTIYTSLGEAGKSLTFKLSDLQMVDYVKSAPELAGALIPVNVTVVTDAGFNSEPFVFNVQF